MGVLIIDENYKYHLYTYTGKRISILNPEHGTICIKDIAHSLSLLCRFSGHCKKFYSVARHSLNVARLIKLQGFPAKTQLYGLLHDAAEAYMCDLPKPVKDLLPQYRSLECEIQSAILNSFNIPLPTPDEYVIVKKNDELLMAIEMKRIMRSFESQPLHNCNDIHTSNLPSAWRLFLPGRPLSFSKPFRYIEYCFINTYEKLVKKIRKEEEMHEIQSHNGHRRQ